MSKPDDDAQHKWGLQTHRKMKKLFELIFFPGVKVSPGVDAELVFLVYYALSNFTIAWSTVMMAKPLGKAWVTYLLCVVATVGLFTGLWDHTNCFMKKIEIHNRDLVEVKEILLPIADIITLGPFLVGQLILLKKMYLSEFLLGCVGFAWFAYVEVVP